MDKTIRREVENMMGALNSIIIELHLSFAGNGVGQTGIADLASCESEKTKWNASCRPHREIMPEREVLIEI